MPWQGQGAEYKLLIRTALSVPPNKMLAPDVCDTLPTSNTVHAYFMDYPE